MNRSLQLSFDLSEYTANVDGVGTLRLLDAIRTCGMERDVKFYQVRVHLFFREWIFLLCYGKKFLYSHHLHK